MRLCDHITVLRDGHVVGSAPRAEMTIDRLITLMVGRTIDQIYPPREPAIRPGTPVLEVQRAHPARRGQGHLVHACSRARSSGISGPDGLGPLGDGAHPVRPRPATRSGTIAIDGAPLREPTPQAAMDRGIAFLTEDRRAEGLMMAAPIADNIGLASLPRLRRRLGPPARADRGSATRSSRTGRDVQVNAARLRRRRWSRTCRAATSRRS